MAVKGRNRIPTFPARLAELRHGAGLTQMELAVRAGTSLSSISQMERGERSPSLELAKRLADGLSVLVDDLCHPPQTPPRTPPRGGKKKLSD